MSRKERRRALNSVPNISLVGTGLDRILHGFITDEVKDQIRKNSGDLLSEVNFDLPDNAKLYAPTPFTPKALDPMAELKLLAKEATGNGALARFALAEIERLTNALAEKEKAA